MPRKGQKLSEEAKQKIREAKKNISEETRRKISEGRKGKAPWNKGIKMTEEERLAMIERVKNVWTDEKRAKQSEILKKAYSDPAVRAKASEIAKGLMTEEHRKKISESTKAAMQKPEVKEKQLRGSRSLEARQKTIKVCMEKYGVPFPCMTEQARNGSKTISKINRKWQDKLGVPDDDLEFALGRYVYDLKIGNTLIEINPSYSHNSSHVPWFGNKKGKALDKYYHINKSRNAENAGYNCFHIWDWDEEEKVINYFADKKRIVARECDVRLVEDKEVVDRFLNTYHFQNTCKGQKATVGLYYGEELVGLMTFGKPRYNKKFEWELLRLCYSKDYSVLGGSNKMFKLFIDLFHPTSIISYCDKSKFSGDVYEKLGFVVLSYSQPSRHWYNLWTGRHITDNLLRQRGYSQLHGDKEHVKGEDNEELMFEAGYVDIWDCGQNSYMWKN
jgi:hypothetical protein